MHPVGDSDPGRCANREGTGSGHRLLGHDGAVTGPLEFVGSDLVHMDKGTFMWVSIKVFRCDPDSSDEALLTALIAHRQYRDHYAGGDPEDQAQDDLHGPYWLAAITPTSFSPTDIRAATHEIQAWADDYRVQGDESQERLASQVFPFLAGEQIYRLEDLRETAQHEWGWVVGNAGFYEYVVIDRSNSRLSLLVASDD